MVALVLIMSPLNASWRKDNLNHNLLSGQGSRPDVRLPLRTEFPFFWEFLGIRRNSQKFLTMQISSDLKNLELLRISGKGRLPFCEDVEFLGIPRNSQLHKLPLI